MIATDDGINLSTLDINSQKCDVQVNKEENQPDSEIKAEDEENEYITNDPIAKSQFNYNSSTCFGDNHPEISVEENTVQDPVQVAPGQGKIPKSILQEKDFDVKSFPCLFPDGKNGKDQERKVALSDQGYWEQRILNVDARVKAF